MTFTPDHRDDVQGEVYGLDLGGRLGGTGRNGASLYIGWCKTGETSRRLAEHKAGRGAKITAAAADRGFEITLAWAVPGTRNDERRFKNAGHYDRLFVRMTANERTNRP